MLLCSVKAWRFLRNLGPSSLTPLAPITMHEMKIETTRIIDPTKYDPSLSPYHSGKCFLFVDFYCFKYLVTLEIAAVQFLV